MPGMHAFALTTGAPAIAAFGGALAVAMAAQAVWWLALNLRASGRCEGTVVGTEIRGIYPEPIVEYVAGDGVTRRFVARSDGYLKVGQTAPVGYEPRAPDRARVVTLTGGWLRPAGPLLVAVLVAYATLAMVERTG